MNWQIMLWTFAVATWAGTSAMITEYRWLKIVAAVAIVDAAAGFVVAAFS